MAAEAVTPLFASWLLPLIEDGYLDGMHASVGVRVPFRYALVHGSFYTSPPIPSPLLARILGRGRRRRVKILYNALIRVSRNPTAADHAVLADLEHQWRDQQLPRYRELAAAAHADLDTAGPRRLTTLVDQLGHEAGVYLWYLAIVGGSAWKMEARLTRFTRRHLGQVLPDRDGGAQVLLRGLPGAQPVATRHAVQSVDWYQPVTSELPVAVVPSGLDRRLADLAAHRTAVEQRCHAALARKPALLHQFGQLLSVNQRYAVIRELQARDFTLAWRVLRACARRLGHRLVALSAIEDAEDVFFCTRDELHQCLEGQARTGPAPRGTARHLAAAAPSSRTGDAGPPAPTGGRRHRPRRPAGPRHHLHLRRVMVGQTASAGRATGPARIVHRLEDFAAFTDGDVLIAKTTAPA
jgi:pyruvate,water dikinase